MFRLDERLQNDCIYLGESADSCLLLMNNSLFIWFILVPKTQIIEFHQLDRALQIRLLDEINALSVFIEDNFGIDKLNTAMIGNIVSQLHIHVIGRKQTDPCWPGVVWGTSHRQAYDNDTINAYQSLVREKLGDRYTLTQFV